MQKITTKKRAVKKPFSFKKLLIACCVFVAVVLLAWYLLLILLINSWDILLDYSSSYSLSSVKDSIFSKAPDLNNYVWEDNNNKDNYQNLRWKIIDSSISKGLDGLWEGKTRGIHEREEQEKALKREGCLRGRYFYLSEKKLINPQRIYNFQELKTKFLPVENENEAVAFVASTTSDLVYLHDKKLLGYTAVTKDGYLVQVVDKNTCGCGSHEDTGAIYKVTKSGEITLLATTPFKSRGLDVCVD